MQSDLFTLPKNLSPSIDEAVQRRIKELLGNLCFTEGKREDYHRRIKEDFVELIRGYPIKIIDDWADGDKHFFKVSMKEEIYDWLLKED